MSRDVGDSYDLTGDSGPVGEETIRVDARDKVTGDAKFADDISPPGVLTAVVVRSSVTRGVVEETNFEEIRGLEGVEAVLTAEDVPGENVVPVIEDDQPAVARRRVRYDGEPVGLLAVDGRRRAEGVREKVEVEYESQEPVLDVFEALKPESPEVAQLDFSEGHNLFTTLTIDKGDVDEAFADAPAVVEREYRTGYQEHAYMEPQGVVALPAPHGGIEIRGTMQCPYYVRNSVSRVLGLPLNKVKVIQVATGGAFGGKEDVPSQLSAYAALLADATGKPVKLIYDRREDIRVTSKRHPSVVRYKSAADNDGHLIGVETNVYLDSGAYQTLSPAVLWRSLAHATGPYSIPNVRIVAKSVATNKVPNGAFRGFGSPQVIFPYESQLELLAEEIDMDPVELRRRNILRPGDRTATNQKLENSVGAAATLDRASELAGWKETKKQYEDWNCNHERVKKGIGVSSVMYGVGMGASAPSLDKAGAYVQLESDGSLTFAVGNTEMGQGAETVLSQIAAGALGVGVNDVNMAEVDTSRVPDSGPTVASRATTMSGTAIINAVDQLKPRIKRVGKGMLECDSVTIENGQVSCANQAGKSVPLAEVAANMWTENVDMSAEGWAEKGVTDWDPETAEGEAYFVFAYATHVTKVEVDTLTGVVDLSQHVAVHDSGKIINPTTAEGQVEGGAAQGIGFALSEDLAMEEGKFVDPDFTNYLVPTARDIPDDLVVDFVEDEYPEGPYGAKGLGEVPLMAAHGSVINAISHAIGSRLYGYPATPENVLTAYLEVNE